MLCTATLPSSRAFTWSGRPAQAWRMLANSVSPPTGGTSRPDSAEECAGAGLKELSVCQS